MNVKLQAQVTIVSAADHGSQRKQVSNCVATQQPRRIIVAVRPPHAYSVGFRVGLRNQQKDGQVKRKHLGRIFQHGRRVWAHTSEQSRQDQVKVTTTRIMS